MLSNLMYCQNHVKTPMPHFFIEKWKELYLRLGFLKKWHQDRDLYTEGLLGSFSGLKGASGISHSLISAMLRKRAWYIKYSIFVELNKVTCIYLLSHIIFTTWKDQQEYDIGSGSTWAPGNNCPWAAQENQSPIKVPVSAEHHWRQPSRTLNYF